ncbi:MAG: response regulator [Chromatiales bacterium]|nr:response regulator [Chromatiales bacterium]
MESKNDRRVAILVVDDTEDNRVVVGAFLATSPVDLVFAENGRVGMECFQAQAFDLVLMGIQMPEMNGLEATREIRKIEADKLDSIEFGDYNIWPMYAPRRSWQPW